MPEGEGCHQTPLKTLALAPSELLSHNLAFPKEQLSWLNQASVGDGFPASHDRFHSWDSLQPDSQSGLLQSLKARPDHRDIGGALSAARWRKEPANELGTNTHLGMCSLLPTLRPPSLPGRPQTPLGQLKPSCMNPTV